MKSAIDPTSPPMAALPNPAGGPLKTQSPALLAVMVLLVAMAVYLPTLSAGFLILDDSQYVTGNPYILFPSWEKLGACFSEVLRPTTVLGYYQPLTLASLMLDRTVEGALAGGYTRQADPFIFHFSNVLLHGINAALTFVLILGLTRQRGLALFCGLLFATHPLNVEVVSWISQRKALLTTLFALVAIITYARFAKSGKPVWYAATLFAYVASLLAKPTGLFLPLIFVLMDVWPLDQNALRRLKEKAPFLITAAVGGWIAYVSQTYAVDLTGQEGHRSIGVTILVACHNLVFYLAKMVLPIRLCPEYLMPDESAVTLGSAPYAIGIIGTLLLFAGCALAFRRRINFAWTLPLAFLLMIGPTLTPVRFTRTIAADRFAYTPMIIGLVLLAELLRRNLSQSTARAVRAVAPVTGAAIIALLAYLSVRQQSVWQNSYTYYGAVIARFPDKPSGHYGLGNAYLAEYHQLTATDDPATEPRRAECLLAAYEEYRKAIEADSDYCYAYYRLGHIDIIRGDMAHGIATIERGLSTPQADPEGNLFLGLAYTHAGQYEQAIEPYERFLAYQPANIEARKNLANALLRTGRAAESLPHFQRLYELDPTDLDGRQNWGVALIMVGRADDAVQQLRSVVDIRTDLTSQETDPARREQAKAKLADAQFTLAGALATVRKNDKAMNELKAALASNPALRNQAASHPAFNALHDLPQWQALMNSMPASAPSNSR